MPAVGFHTISAVAYQHLATMSSVDDEQQQDDILDLCAMVEEYKECFEIAQNENQELKEQLQLALLEIERLKDVEASQAGVISRLDESVNQLVEEIEQNNEALAAKDNDLTSLQHVLSVIHKRKVEVDDQTLLQQTKLIETLTAEKSKLSESYSANLKILEDYLDIINQKDSQIMDLTHTIKQLELELQTMREHESETKSTLSSSVTDQLEPHEQGEDVVARPAVTTHASPVKVKVQSNRANPSPPTSAPPSHYMQNSSRPTTAPVSRQTTLFTDNPAHSENPQERLAAVRRASTAIYKSNVDPEFSSEDDNNDEEPSPTVPVTISRNRSTRMARTNSSVVNGSTSGTTIGLHSKSTNNIKTSYDGNVSSGTSAEQKAAALSKYRRYVALNTTTGPSYTNNYTSNTPNTLYTDKHTYTAVDNAMDDVDAESAFIDTASRVDTTHSTAPVQTKWSDVGKHERLFDHVEIIKAPSNTEAALKSNGAANVLNAAKTRRKSQPTAEYEPNINTFTHPTLNTTVSTHQNKAKRSTADDLNTSTTSIHSTTSDTSHVSHINTTNDSVEIFVQVDSNPPSPARTKPNNKVFKPPFSKPVFNEFTQNTKSKKSGADNEGSGTEKSDSGMWAKRTSSYQAVNQGDQSPVADNAVLAEPVKSSFLFRRTSGQDVYGGSTSNTNTNINVGGKKSIRSPDSTRL